MNKLDLSQQISRNPDVGFTQIDDDLVMMGPNDNLFYGVNAMGTKIWSLLECNSLSLSEICEVIQRDYDVHEQQCIDDVTRFVEEMMTHHMVVTN